MENHELENYWKQVEKVGRKECLSDEAMLVLGNVFGQMSAEIENLTKRVEELERFEAAWKIEWE
ncbi:hypothetical protein [Metasolibacillus meyeri]|uniref:hypothetical protein n=1 Tax=Metasolibacillus meyeri TaxID=1071052 RepID=UPI000D32168C|nr:hypothetical protein [Metasolibacillus meyeri]